MRPTAARRAFDNWRSQPLRRGRDFSRPILIVGAGRSGSTLLRRTLQAHSEVHIPPETHVLGHAIRTYARFRFMDWPDLVRLVLSQFDYQPGFDSFELCMRDVAISLDRTPRTERSCARIVDTLYRAHAENHGGSLARWGDKSPYNSLSLDAIEDVFPDAQFLHIIRDGADVVPSMVQAGICPSPESAADRWVESVTVVDAYATQHPATVLRIRYEDLVSTPREAIARICSFLGLSLEPAMLESESIAPLMGDVPRLDHHARAREPITTGSIGQGRNRLPRKVRTELAATMNPCLEHFGYEPL